MPQRPLEVRDAIAAAAGPVRLRAATPADVPALVEMVNAAYASSESHVFPGSRRTERDRVLLRLERVVVAEQDRSIVGCVDIDLAREPAHFGMLAVVPALHGSGIGSVLIARAEEMARAAGRTRMCIEVVKEAGRVPYYERRGYRTVRETPGQEWNEGADWGAAGNWHMVDMEKDL